MRSPAAVAVIFFSSCFMAHESSEPERDGCFEPTLGDVTLSAEEAAAILERLQHEVEHALERGLREMREEVDVDGELATISGTATEDGGRVVYAGELEVAATWRGRIAIQFTRWTGGHGAFGPSALEGQACVSFSFIDAAPMDERVTADVSATVGLVGGGALLPAPTAVARYTVDWELPGEAILEGTVGGHPIDTL